MISFEITPPRAGSLASKSSPKPYLTSITVTSVRHKTKIQQLDKDAMKDLRLDPKPIKKDHTILQYYKRITAPSSPFAESRDKLKLDMPCGELFTKLQDSQTLVEESMKNEDFAAKLEAMKLEIQKQSAIHESQVAYFARSEAHMTEMEDFKEKTVQSYEDYVLYRTCNDRDQLVMYEANFISVFILTLCRRLGLKTDGLDNKGSDPDHCSDRYKTAWQIFKPISKAETWLKKTGLDFKYYQKLKNVDNLFSRRNVVAHQSSASFARLLTDPEFVKGPHNHLIETYTPLFQYCYRDPKDGRELTLKECAALTQIELDKYLVLRPDEHQTKGHKQSASMP
ncbi:MAG: hypothetical protein L6R38_008299 [Xanthoria sp. 2 TBL-2021]|nr:MAG: hypothetical protein L6R38_008299 [Xanthoria sp. 2 TBL-2021]